MTTNPTPKQQEEARELPRWSDCEAAIDDKRATPLERFIYEYEPGDNDDLWRERLQAALSSRDQEIREVLEGCASRTAIAGVLTSAASTTHPPVSPPGGFTRN